MFKLIAIGLISLFIVTKFHHVITYSCPICHHVEEFQESSFSEHFCTGTKEHPHYKQRMNKIGVRDVTK